MAKPFKGPEQEHLVLLDRTSQRSSELIASVRRSANSVIEEVAGIQGSVTEKLKRAPVKLVGSRGSHNGDLSSGPFSILSPIGVRENVEFPHALHAEQLPARSIWRYELPGCGSAHPVDPIDGIPVGFRPLSCHGEHVPGAAVERIRSGIGNAHIKQNQIIEATAVQG